MKRVYVLSMMLLFALLGWSQSASSSQQINIKYKNGNSVQINANDIDYIEFTETANDIPQPVPPPTPQPVNPSAGSAVDLGLSVKWASCNVGATSCEEFGDRVAWGELSPKSEYTKNTYQYYDTDNKSYVDIGTDIGGTARDVAHVRWGGGWRMPTRYELKELREDCTWTWSKVNGVNGYIVKGKNGNSIFFPVEDKTITLWACNLGEDEREGYYGVAELIRFSSSSYTWDNSGEDRWKGNYIRPVCHDEDLSGSSASGNYLTFVAEEKGTFDFQHHYINKRLVYSLDNGLTWYRLTSKTKPPTVQAGKKIMWKADFSGSGYKGYFKSSGRFYVEGNIMSLIYGDFFEGKTDLTGTDEAFRTLFSKCARLTNAEKLILPATTLSDDCYNGMFSNCTSLTTPPQLPATKLANGCYMSMFEKCTSLTTAPTLPSTTLSDVCYGNMFEGCSRLNYIKCLATDISAYGCTISWVNGVSSSGTFVKASSMSSWKTGENGIPSGWSITESGTTNSDNDNPQPVPTPVNPQPGGNDNGKGDMSGKYLTFVALEDGCFRFKTYSIPICYSLDGGSTWSILNSEEKTPIVRQGQKILWKGNLTPSSSYPWGVGSFSSTGRFDVEGNAMSLLFSDNFEGKTSLAGKDCALAYLFRDNTNVVSAKSLILPATTLVNSCYRYMFANCTNLITAPQLPAMTLAEECYECMFSSCTSLTVAPELPATTLANECYRQMFQGCNSLNYIKCLATDISAIQCTYHWVQYVQTNSGTFVKAASMNDWRIGDTGIPSGWTVYNE